MLAISVENVSKVYRLGEIDRSQFFGDIRRWCGRMINGSRNQGSSESDDEPNQFWALNDVSFDIKEGETIAVIGRNGAGKSTLLKLLSRITAPTRGNIRLNGRIASLLEVGTGFHYELTGRDNVYLSGTIMGMNRHEIRAKFDQIVEFAGLEQFIDTPVKRYSNGMLVRLAFSVAAHLEPEILILDEVLAVGDQQFHNQCIDRIHEIVKDGRTILLVSHNMSYVRRLSNRTLWMQKGRLLEFGPTEEVINRYEASSTAMGKGRRTGEGERRATIASWRLVEGMSGEPNVLARPGAACAFEFVIQAAEALNNCRFEMRISDPDDVPVFVAIDKFPGMPVGSIGLVVSMPSLPLHPGQYRLEARLFQRHEEVDRWTCDPLFAVADGGLSHLHPGGGLLLLDHSFQIRPRTN
ncbi:MAG: ATP-binding cassette domain-containing protein [Verrucomicrobiaceae bacterium]|nr:MAG: ATP-binding cassette domain-containing protein [Verrucomicrobiaceae bacterium]